MTGALITAAGKGSRMHTKQKKQYMEINEMPILAWTLSIVEACDCIDKIVITVSNDDIDFCINEIIKKYKFNKVHDVVSGGNTRQSSVKAGLKAFEDIAGDSDIILIHDGVRPLVTGELILRCVNACRMEIEKYGHGSVCAAVPVKETIRITKKKFSQKETIYADETLDRSLLWAVQTPQVFNFKLIMDAHTYALENNIEVTDDNALAEIAGVSTRIVQGEYSNTKLTTAEDLNFIKYILEDRKAIL